MYSPKEKSAPTDVYYHLARAHHLDEQIDKAIESLTVPISRSPSPGTTVSGIIASTLTISFVRGVNEFYQDVVTSFVRKDFQIGSEDTNDVLCGPESLLEDSKL